jgi:hypothetical protein
MTRRQRLSWRHRRSGWNTPWRKKFDGYEPIAVMDFLRSLKESGDHNTFGEGVVARQMPYFLKGAAEEEYLSYMKKVPASKPLHPYTVQHMLETYANDDEVAKACHMDVTIRQREMRTNARLR